MNNGLIWPMCIASYKVGIVLVNIKDEIQTELANKIYKTFLDKRIEPILDDRDERASVKFKDMELIGILVRITVDKLTSEGKIEFRKRTDSENTILDYQEAIEQIIEETNKNEYGTTPYSYYKIVR